MVIGVAKIPWRTYVRLLKIRFGGVSRHVYVNITAQKPITNENPVLEQSCGSENAAEWWVFCRKGFPRLQRGLYGNATVAPLEGENGSVADPGGPYGRKRGGFLGRKNGFWVVLDCTVSVFAG